MSNRYDLLIETIIIWNDAYPLEMFPEPPSGEHGETVDACSARMGRHIIGTLMGVIAECETPPVRQHQPAPEGAKEGQT